MKIESLQNSKVKEWNKLKEKRYRDQKKLFLIEGDHLLEEALKKGVVKEIITTTSKFFQESIPCYEVTDNIMKKISSQKSIPEVIAICEKLEPKEVFGTVCLLDNIQDPGNLGTILRSAQAFSIQTIILSEDSVDLYNEKVIRSSEGMIFHINVIKGNIATWIEKLKQLNYTIYGTDVKKGTSLQTIKWEKKTAMIIGSEGNGVKKEHLNQCEKKINIPISSTCESLNASVAASIIFYEWSKQKL